MKNTCVPTKFKTGTAGLDLIKEFEGCKLTAYKCPAGIWTIGWGSTGPDIKEGMKITMKEAERRLIAYLEGLEKSINRLGLKINQNQFDALVSFCYNVGFGNFIISTLLKRIKINVSESEIRAQFYRWNTSKGKILPGLIKRREAEANLYFTR